MTQLSLGCQERSEREKNVSGICWFADGLQVTTFTAFGQIYVSTKSLKLAVEAVISELVSRRLFPVLRENTAKFADFRPRDDNGPRLCIGNSIAYHRNSLNTKTGKPFA